MKITPARSLAVLLLGLSLSCTKVYNQQPLAPTQLPAQTPPTPVADAIEFRVFGSTGTAPVLIKYTNSKDGLTALTSISLPYVASVKNLETSIFLDLEATSTPLVAWTNAYLQVQIYVNGKLFREAFVSNVTPLSVIANGTFRRGE